MDAINHRQQEQNRETGAEQKHNRERTEQETETRQGKNRKQNRTEQNRQDRKQARVIGLHP